MKIMNLKFRFFATGLVLGMLFGVFIGRIGRMTSPPAKAVEGTLTITGSGQTLSGDITAARIVDNANSAYFIDPAAAGTSLSLAGNASISGTMTMASNQPFRPAFGQHNHTGSTSTNGSHGGHFAYGAGGSQVNAGDRTAVSDGAHSHTFTTDNAGSVAGTNAPYIQLTACKKD